MTVKTRTRIFFYDCDEVIAGDSISTGMVNGERIFAPNGDWYFVPVWCERDNGREATTVYVKSTNIMKVEEVIA